MVVGLCALDMYAGGPFKTAGLRVCVGVPETLCVRVSGCTPTMVCARQLKRAPVRHLICFLAPCPYL